ncbi:hypothetical protein [Corynebacterium imitans]|nr:hypothetical protein [Corynebacterium imitans]
MENMDTAEAREALAAVRATEARATASAQRVPWLHITATSVCFGAGMTLTLLGHAWGLLVLLVGIVGIVWIEFSAKRGVRTAMKQEVREDPKLNWKAAIAPLLAYPVMMLAQTAGTTAVITLGVLFTVGFIAAYGLTWSKYHD